MKSYTVFKITHCVWNYTLFVKLHTYFLPAISKQLLSRTNWKILHLTNFFYTTSGCDGCDNYQVWLRVCLCSTQDLLIIFFLYLAFNLHCFLFVFLLEIVFVYTSALVNEEEAVLVACMSVLYSRLADCNVFRLWICICFFYLCLYLKLYL